MAGGSLGRFVRARPAAKLVVSRPAAKLVPARPAGRLVRARLTHESAEKSAR